MLAIHFLVTFRCFSDKLRFSCCSQTDKGHTASLENLDNHGNKIDGESFKVEARIQEEGYRGRNNFKHIQKEKY